MNTPMSLQELSAQANAWCSRHAVVPINGQVGEEVSERTVRYYRTLGLLDAPTGGAYREKHLLQLIALRLLQAQGLPLRRIRELLYGLSEQQLRELAERGARQHGTAATALPASSGDTLWRCVPISDDFLLISRKGTLLSDEQRRAVAAALGVSSPT